MDGRTYPLIEMRGRILKNGGPTDRRTDTASYRDARTHLKMQKQTRTPQKDEGSGGSEGNMAGGKKMEEEEGGRKTIMRRKRSEGRKRMGRRKWKRGGTRKGE